MDGSVILSTAGIGVGVLTLLTLLFFVVLAVAQVVRSQTLDYLFRVAWVVAIILFPAVGTIAWFAVGDRTPEVQQALRLCR